MDSTEHKVEHQGYFRHGRHRIINYKLNPANRQTSWQLSAELQQKQHTNQTWRRRVSKSVASVFYGQRFRHIRVSKKDSCL